tara:strand:- start:4149 stop:4469 length:321 start_codon:yes stop_codon:yes gene_type:complete
MTYFEHIDHPKTPSILKPMTKLHDDLVNGHCTGRTLKVGKLIKKLEKNISKQVEELVDIEEKASINANKVNEMLQTIQRLIRRDDLSSQAKDIIMSEMEETYERLK